MTRETHLISVAIAGPWWTNLTYRAPRKFEAGVRVRVPMGKGTRVGLVLPSDKEAGDVSEIYDGELREVLEAIDETPILPEATLPLLDWFCNMYLCGMGTAMKALLPTNFLQGAALDPGKDVSGFCPEEPSSADISHMLHESGIAFVYEPFDEKRYERYAELIADGKPSLVVFPLYGDAKAFADFAACSAAVPPDVKNRILLFPRSGAKEEWRMWSRLIGKPDPSGSIVIGGQSAAMAPVKRLARVIVDDESNGIWRTIRKPVYNVRSLLAVRARMACAGLVLGGRMPSARAFMQMEGKKKSLSGKPGKLFFVDQKLAYAPEVKGVQDTLAVSEPLVRETNLAIERNSWAIWILDRKGYAGEILCDECGVSVRCAKCGGTMRWEASSSRLRCIACGAVSPVPDSCPNCKGRLLMAKRPGIDALLTLAKAAVHGPVPVISLEDEDDGVSKSVESLSPGLLIGTRAALALCDKLSVGLVGWIDADGEARSQEYDARVRAFGLIWESRWRGRHPEERRVLLQSRRPGREWQKGIEEGWHVFWQRELRERKLFSLPPFMSLIRLESGRSDAGFIAEKLDRAGFEYWIASEQEDKKQIVWIRTRRLGELRSLLASFFHIRRARRGFPAITVWHD